MVGLQGLFLNRSWNIMVGFLEDPDMLPWARDVTSERLKAARVWQGARWEVRSLMSWEPLWSWSLLVLDEGHCGLDIFQTAGKPNLSTYYKQSVLLPCFRGLFLQKKQKIFKLFEQSTLKLRARAKLRIDENNKQTSNALSGGIIAGAMISPQR